MKRLRVATLCLLLLVLCGLLGYLYLDREMDTFHTPVSPTPFEIPSGVSARDVLRILNEHGVIGDENLTMIYLVLSGQRKGLKAGEYLFDRQVTPREAIDKLAVGAIHLHRFTVPEGLTLTETALKWQEQGFGKAEDFAAAARDSLDLVSDFEGNGSSNISLEGYLFPETYFFAIRTTPRRAIEAMVARFRTVLKQLEKSVPMESWPLKARDTVVLASLVEAEAAVDSERPLIASVFLNRLKLRILLQCDPTVIYALEKTNRYEGRLTTADLKVDSPYNTYRYPGLPPGPIGNPGKRSLEAVTKPAVSRYLYFVRTTDGRHTVSENLAAHNRAVAAYRAQVRSAHP